MALSMLYLIFARKAETRTAFGGELDAEKG